MITGLHHAAYRCSDSERTRRFYEDFLGLPLVNAILIPSEENPDSPHSLHTFFAMHNGACLAFFEAPSLPFEFKRQHDFDLHIALEVPRADLPAWKAKGEQAGVETRGIVDHDFVESVYFRDPDGYVVEVTAKRAHHASAMDPEANAARDKLNLWQNIKPSAPRSGRTD